MGTEQREPCFLRLVCALGRATRRDAPSDDKLASILAYIEEAESTTEEQHATATAMVAHANRVVPPPPPQARQPVHLADLTSDERAVEGVERRLRFTPDRPESDAGSAFTASEAAAHDALGKGVHEAADLARLTTAPPPPACGPTSSARGSAYASASELGNRPSARRGRPSMQSASAIVASGGSSRGGGTPAAAASPADAGNSGGGAVASGAEYVTPPGAGGSKAGPARDGARQHCLRGRQAQDVGDEE